MADWMFWLAFAGVLVIFELFTGTFYVLMIAIGVAFGAAAALLGFGLPVQVLTAAVIGLAATGLLHRSRLGRPDKADPARDRNVNLDIGQSVRVDTWTDGKARVMYRGAQWDVELAPGTMVESADFKIVEVRGSRLIVANK